ncbi:hypothetical protein EAG_07052 [Camponotus floridanus]|uniref:Uncharacterized protein n=1 Tax=Camponotus floridanus TaxID=104421 RepID=E2AST7_CAMFO|nr:hypothetical protein EAG_07052 [Camponotus floridanus]
MRRSTRRSITLWSTLCPGKLLRDAPVVDNFRLSDYTSVADDRATTASTTRFQIVVCGRSTSPKRKLTPTATMRSHHTPRCVPLRTRSSEVQNGGREGAAGEAWAEGGPPPPPPCRPRDDDEEKVPSSPVRRPWESSPKTRRVNRASRARESGHINSPWKGKMNLHHGALDIPFPHGRRIALIENDYSWLESLWGRRRIVTRRANHHTKDAIPSDLPQRADARTSLCQRDIPGVFGDRLVSPSARQSFEGYLLTISFTIQTLYSHKTRQGIEISLGVERAPLIIISIISLSRARCARGEQYSKFHFALSQAEVNRSTFEEIGVRDVSRLFEDRPIYYGMIKNVRESEFDRVGKSSMKKRDAIIVKSRHAPDMPTERIQLVEIPTDCHGGLSRCDGGGGGSLFMNKQEAEKRDAETSRCESEKREENLRNLKIESLLKEFFTHDITETRTLLDNAEETTVHPAAALGVREKLDRERSRRDFKGQFPSASSYSKTKDFEITEQEEIARTKSTNGTARGLFGVRRTIFLVDDDGSGKPKLGEREEEQVQGDVRWQRGMVREDCSFMNCIINDILHFQ